MNFKKFLAVLMTAVMAMCAMAVPAFAAPPFSTSTECGVCGEEFKYYPDGAGIGPETYQEYYNVGSIEGLASLLPDDSLACYTSNIELKVTQFNGHAICESCLESKINEYKESGSIGGSTDGTVADNSTASGTTNVTASVNSNCTIVIPESVTLSKTDNVAGSGEYTKSFEVIVKGDVPEDATVTITADNPTLKATGAKDVTAVLTMDKTQWNRTDIIANSGEGTASNCNLKATLTPGTWTGTMTYNIVLTGKFDLTA